MLSFKELGLEDRETITKFTLNSPCMSCDISFSSLMSWKFMYDTRFTIIEDFLVLRYNNGDRLTYMIPIGTGKNIEQVIDSTIEDAEKHGSPFLMLTSESYLAEKLNAQQLNRFSLTCDRNYSEYIYNRNDLATLKGIKYQRKRNHVNKFKKSYPNWKYLELTPDLVEDCLYMEKEWYKANIDKDPRSIELERRALTFAITHIKETGGYGGVLCVDNKIAAFSLGCPINQNTFDVQFEKADTQFNGSYTAINQIFVQHLPDRFTYINREEDLGLPGLRKAKLSYNPVKMLSRCMLTLK